MYAIFAGQWMEDNVAADDAPAAGASDFLRFWFARVSAGAHAAAQSKTASDNREASGPSAGSPGSTVAATEFAR